MTYINAVKYILSLPDSTGDVEEIERMRTICDILGNPQKKLRCIHTCGDVGKDSCLSMLEAVLKNASLRFGRCSLSFSDEPRECITVDQKSIPHSELADIIKNLSKIYKSRFKDSLPSKSEVLTLASVIYFTSSGCDVALFERGSRKNDPASITDPPIVSLLTPFWDRELSDGRLEHLIPKGTVETVSSPQHKEIFNSVSQACVLAGSRLTVPIYGDMEIKSITLFKTEFLYRGEQYSIRSFSPCQTVNAITVIETVNALSRCGLQADLQSLKKGLFSARLDGKCEAISIQPTVIVASVFEKEHLNTLVASLAQVKEQFSKSIEVYVDIESNIDLDALSDSLSAHEIPHSSPVALSVDKTVELFNDFSALPTDASVILIGSQSFISKSRQALKELFIF